MSRYFFLISFTIILMTEFSYGTVISDSTLGTEVVSSNSNYQITGGKVKDNNIFHSFEKFSLESHESAQFNDAGFINSISRITGSEISHIDGMITTDAENFYFLNPNGVVLGPNAILNTMGSFHISTADYIQFPDNEIFYVDPIQTSLLSSASPSAFGFFDDEVGPINIDSMFAYFMEDKTFSIIGGEININDSIFQLMSGHLNIVGISSPCIVQADNNDLIVTSEKLANITILDSYLDFQGSYPASLCIYGKTISLINNISPDEPWTWNNYGIWLQQYSNENQKSLVRLNAQEDVVWENVFLHGSGNNNSNAASLFINAKNISISGISEIDLSGNGSGETGIVEMIAHENITISDDARFFVSSHQTSKPGHILFDAGDTIQLDMNQRFDTNTWSTIPSIDIGGDGTGDSGEMIMHGKKIHILNDTLICGNVNDMRNMGKINISADEEIKIISEKEFLHENISFFSRSGGNGGKISIDAPEIYLNNAMIFISNRNTGPGAVATFSSSNLTIENNSSINLVNYDDAHGCQVSIFARNNIIISGRSAFIEVGSYGTQKGGILRMEADNIYVLNGAVISTDTSHTGNGGELNITAHKKLYMFSNETGDMYHGESRISSRAIAPDNQFMDGGDGGIIRINAPYIELGRTAKIFASTYSTGNAGKIIIETDHLSMSKYVTDNASSSISTASIHRKGKDQDGVQHGSAGQIIIGKKIIQQENGWHVSEPAGLIALYNNSTISSTSEGRYSNDAGSIALGVSNLVVDHSTIKSCAIFSQDDASYISLSNAGRINIGGRLHINNDSMLLFSDIYSPSNQIDMINASISTLAYGSADANDTSSAGSIMIKTKYLNLLDNAAINSAIENVLQTDILYSGNAGNIIIETPGDNSYIKLDDSSHITTSTEATQPIDGNETKAAISIFTSGLKLYNCSFIQSSSINRQAGEISIKNSQNSILPDIILNNESYLSTISFGGGDAGDIDIEGENIEIINNSFVSSANIGHENEATKSYDFHAGSINLYANKDLLITNSGQITTDSYSGGGGKIFLSGGPLYLLESEVISNVNDGNGRGGDISLLEGKIILNKYSRVSANAVWGDGGAIFIESDIFIKSNNSVIEATSEFGNDGEVTIYAPDIDISSALIILPTNYLDASQWLRNSCAYKSSENISRLIIKGKDAFPSPIDDFLPSPGLFSDF